MLKSIPRAFQKCITRGDELTYSYRHPKSAKILTNFFIGRRRRKNNNWSKVYSSKEGRRLAKYGIISGGYWQYISNISGIYWQYISNMCSHQQQKDTSSEAGGWQPLHISRPTLCSKQSLAPLHICMVLVLVHLHGTGTFAWQEHQH